MSAAADPSPSTATRVALAFVVAYALVAVVSWGGLADVAAASPSADLYAAPSPAHWLGTNQLGQDVLARLVAGTGDAVALGGIVALGAVALGTLLGGLAGFGGRRADAIVTAAAGVLEAVPVILVAGAAAFAGGGGGLAWPLVLVSIFWTPTARAVRTQVLRLERAPFVEAARAAGLGRAMLLRRHVLPHCRPVLLAQVALTFVAAVKTQAVLAFLGLGARSASSWGGMLAQSAQEIGSGHFQNFVAASLAFAGLVLAANVLADGVPATRDPRDQDHGSAS